MGTTKCTNCGADLGEIPPFMKITRCATCMAQAAGFRLVDEVSEKARREHQQRQQHWRGICPSRYDNTDPGYKDMPQEILQRVMAWNGWEEGRGVGLIGPSRRCKTRMMFLLLKKWHFETDARVFAIRATAFAKACGDAFSQNEEERRYARKVLEKARQADLLFFDDIGKERFTDRVELEFYDLLEERSSWMLPTLWTSNATGAELHQRMSDDRAIPIIGRLKEFSEIITVS